MVHVLFFLAVMLAVLDVYRNVLLERQRRKNIIKNYGLINFRKQHMKERKYYQTMGFQKMEKLRGLMKVFKYIEHYYDINKVLHIVTGFI